MRCGSRGAARSPPTSIAFALTGYASVAALHDVVADSRTILRWPLGDPHPVGWLRVLLGVAMCRAAFGPGPWDRLEEAVVTANPLSRAESRPRPCSAVPRADGRSGGASASTAPVPGFGRRPVTTLVDPPRLAPRAVRARAGRRTGPWTSPHWRASEGIRIVALAGLREAEHPERAGQWVERAEAWMTDVTRAA